MANRKTNRVAWGLAAILAVVLVENTFWLRPYCVAVYWGEGADLRHTELLNAPLRGANLSYCRLQQANLEGADLRNANLDGAELQQTQCKGGNPRGGQPGLADLTGADLPGSGFDAPI